MEVVICETSEHKIISVPQVNTKSPTETIVFCAWKSLIQTLPFSSTQDGWHHIVSGSSLAVNENFRVTTKPRPRSCLHLVSAGKLRVSLMWAVVIRLQSGVPFDHPIQYTEPANLANNSSPAHGRGNAQ